VRTTLNDELMRDAGFETDYYRELERRRERRRHLMLRAAVRAGWLVLLALAVIDLWAPHFSGIPKPIAAGAVTILGAVQLGDFVKNRLLPWLADRR
jgi:hypothetical protein